MRYSSAEKVASVYEVALAKLAALSAKDPARLLHKTRFLGQRYTLPKIDISKLKPGQQIAKRMAEHLARKK